MYSCLDQGIKDTAGQIILVGSGMIIDDLHMSGGNKWAQLLIGHASHCTVINSTFADSHYGMRVQGAYDLTVSNVSTSNNHIAYSIVSTSGSTFCNTRLEGSIGGMVLKDSHDLDIDDVVMRDIDIGLEVSYSHDCTITGSEFSGNGDGILLDHSERITVFDCEFLNDTVGIRLSTAMSCTVENNLIACEGATGIYLEMASEMNLIRRNILNNCSHGVHFYYPTGAFGYNVIQQNSLINNTFKIRLDSSSKTEVLDNSVYGGEVGILVVASAHCVIDGNFIEMSDRGIVNVAQKTTIINNVLHNTTTSTLVPGVDVTRPDGHTGYAGSPQYNMKWKWMGMPLNGSISGYEVRLNDGNWTSVSSSTSHVFSLVYRNNTGHVRTTDTGNNIYWTSIEIIYFANPPPITILSPRQDQYLNSTQVTVT
jgi:parallel beta-helix repeat protein